MKTLGIRLGRAASLEFAQRCCRNSASGAPGAGSSDQHLRCPRCRELCERPATCPSVRDRRRHGTALSVCGLVCLLLLAAAPAAVSGASKRAELLYNTAVEGYLNEDYGLALEAIRESIKLDAENERTKQFAIKLLMQMATKAHLGKRHKTAMRYLEEARAIDPHNKRIDELCMMIQLKLGSQPPPEAAAPPKKEAKKPAAPPMPGLRALEFPIGTAVIPKVGKAEKLKKIPVSGASVLRRISETSTSEDRSSRYTSKDPKRRRAAPPPAALTKPTALPDVPAPPRTSASLRASERASGAPTVPSRWLGAGASGSSGSGPEGLRPPIGRTTAFPWKAAMAVSALLVICIGSGIFYLRRVQERMSRDSIRSFLEVKKSLEEEKELVEKTLKEQAMREKEKKEVEERDRQAARERERQAAREWAEREHRAAREREKKEQEERDRRAARERDERERLGLEGRRRRDFEQMIQPQPKETKIKEEIRVEGLVSDAYEASRELAFKGVATQILAYKRLASQLRDIYDLDKERALDSIRPLLENSDPQVRAYLAGGLSQLPIPEFARILFQLWKDPDMKVKSQSLRGLHNFHKRPDFTRIFPEELQVQIRQLVEQERLKGDWVL